jgi:hypothetical protein
MDMTAHAQRRRERSNRAAGGAVRLHIDHLVLRGVAPGEAGRMTHALETELTQLAAQSGTRFVPMEAERLPAAPIVAGRVPEQTGRAVAAAVWSGIGQKGRQP